MPLDNIRTYSPLSSLDKSLIFASRAEFTPGETDQYDAALTGSQPLVHGIEQIPFLANSQETGGDSKSLNRECVDTKVHSEFINICRLPSI